MDKNIDNSLYQVFHQVIGLHHYRCHQLLENQGIYRGQPPLLFALHKEDGQSQKDLSEKLGIQPATITMMVKRMAKAGLIERRQDKEDQRVSRVYLTDEGREARKRGAIIAKQVEEDCFKGLSEKERDSLKGILVQIRENLLQTSHCKNKI